jgi:hypothetical protein
MAGACGKISQDIISSCSEKIYSGLEVDIALINADDIASITKDVSNDLLATAIALNSTTKAYKLTGVKLSNVERVEFVPGSFQNFWRHVLEFRIFANDAAIKKELSNMEQSQLVAVVENKYKGTNGNGAFEILGADTNLFLNVATRATDDTDTGGAWNVTIQSDDNSLEPNPPLSFFDTDYATTKAAFDALFTVVP